MRDVNNGWLIRYLHSNTASAFFFLVENYEDFSCLYFDIYTENNSMTTVPLVFNTVLFSKLKPSSQGTDNPGSLSVICSDKKEISQGVCEIAPTSKQKKTIRRLFRWRLHRMV